MDDGVVEDVGTGEGKIREKILVINAITPILSPLLVGGTTQGMYIFFHPVCHGKGGVGTQGSEREANRACITGIYRDVSRSRTDGGVLEWVGRDDQEVFVIMPCKPVISLLRPTYLPPM